MENYLTKEIKNLSGTLLGIGIESEKLKNEIQKNNDIKTCYLLEENNSKLNKKKMKIFNKTKKINIKKIRKIFKKKRINNIICNYKTIKPFLKTFIGDSVYINKNNIYIYDLKEDYDKIIQKYNRYTDKIDIKKIKNGFIIIINTANAKNNKLKDIKYWWTDSLNNIADVITKIIVN